MFKKSALAVVVAASMIPAAAMADTTVYGQARVFMLNNSNVNDASVSNPAPAVDPEIDAWEMVSDASRLGVKGSAELDHGLEVIYKYEFEVDPTDGEAGGAGDVLKARNQYIGLKGDFGQVVFGKHDTPLKKSQGKVDLFSDVPYSDIKNTLEGENRINNLVYYKSPKIADAINIHVAFAPGEDSDVDGVASTKANAEEETGIADSKSLAVSYKTDSLYLALANDTDIDKHDSLTRLTAQFNADVFGVGAIFQTGEFQGANADEEEGFAISAYFKASDNIKLKAQVATSEKEDSTGQKVGDEEQLTLGVDYKLGKKTTAVAFFSQLEDNKFAAGTKTSSTENDILGLGLIHKF